MLECVHVFLYIITLVCARDLEPCSSVASLPSLVIVYAYIGLYVCARALAPRAYVSSRLRCR